MHVLAAVRLLWLFCMECVMKKERKKCIHIYLPSLLPDDEACCSDAPRENTSPSRITRRHAQAVI